MFNQAIIRCRVGRNHHGAAGEFAVVEGKEEAGTRVEIGFAIDAQRKWPAPELREAKKNGQKVAGLAPAGECARAGGVDIGGERRRHGLHTHRRVPADEHLPDPPWAAI